VGAHVVPVIDTIETSPMQSPPKPLSNGSDFVLRSRACSGDGGAS